MVRPSGRGRSSSACHWTVISPAWPYSADNSSTGGVVSTRTWSPPGPAAWAQRTAPAELRVAMRNQNYLVWDWDPETGKPSKEKLLELGLDNVAADLWG